MKPHCHNRPARGGGWILHALRKVKGRMVPVYRYQYPWFTDRCAAWDSGPSPISESVPAREGWRCQGCRWLPGEAGVYLERWND